MLNNILSGKNSLNRSLSRTGKQPGAQNNQITQAPVIRTPPLPVVRLPTNSSLQDEKVGKPSDKDRPKINVTRMYSNVSNEVKTASNEVKTLKNIISYKASPSIELKPSTSIATKRNTKAQEKLQN